MSNNNHIYFSNRLEYERKNIEDKILLNLRDLGYKIHFLYDGKDSQRRVLIMLRQSGDMSQRELTDRLSIRPGSMSEVLTKLTNKGLIYRVQNDSDKRTMTISLTDEGKRTADEAMELRTEKRLELLSRLEEKEKHSLLLLLEKINTV